MSERARTAPKRLTGSGPAPSVGFLADSIQDARYHWQVLRGAMGAAYDRGANLLCFVGGMLLPESAENEHNRVFHLAKAPNVDAVVVLSGSLGNAVGSEGLTAYCQQYSPAPMCSIALPLPGMSSVCIDNEGGMRSVVEHLVRAHGIRTLAFVRGPAANDEAELRLRAYREVLGANGIAYEPELVVSGDFTASSGRQAVQTLFGDRGLAVGAVGAIVAANDAMALGALEELKKRGVRVPEQIALVGFDNVEEARFVLPALTTVSQPLLEQGREAVRVVLEQLRTGSRAPEQALRHTELMTRRSCGCLQGSSNKQSSAPPSTTLGFDAALIRRRQHILTDMARAAHGELGPAGAQWDLTLLNAAADQIRGDRQDAFIRAYDDLLRRLLLAGADPTVCNDVLSALRGRLVRCVGDARRRMYAEDIFHEARVMTTHAVERIHVAREMRVWEDARTLMRAGTAIGSSGSIEELGRAVHEHLPRLGVPRCFVIRLLPGEGPEDSAQVVLAEKPDARKSDPTLSAVYPANGVLRHAVLPGTDEHAFAIFPSHFKDGQRCIVVLELGGALEGHGYEALNEVFAATLGRMTAA